ncbi:hypothetical protein ES703_04174 [subsurface metagenome]|nr:hypothetical protein [bacterium]
MGILGHIASQAELGWLGKKWKENRSGKGVLYPATNNIVQPLTLNGYMLPIEPIISFDFSHKWIHTHTRYGTVSEDMGREDIRFTVQGFLMDYFHAIRFPSLVLEAYTRLCMQADSAQTEVISDAAFAYQIAQRLLFTGTVQEQLNKLMTTIWEPAGGEEGKFEKQKPVDIQCPLADWLDVSKVVVLDFSSNQRAGKAYRTYTMHLKEDRDVLSVNPVE